MFRQKTAWFSSSVPQTLRNFWILEGGTVAGWRTADYLFTEDASCPDTLRIFESQDYLREKVVVFHSLFLSTCEKRQSVKSVCIGHFVLPPASVQDEVRTVVGRLIWECEDELSGACGLRSSFNFQTDDECNEGVVSRSKSQPSDIDSSECKDPTCCQFQGCSVRNMLTGYASMDSLQKYTADLSDFNPGCIQCSHCKAHCCSLHT